MDIEWNSTKNAANIARHGVDFVDASAALLDPLAITFDDPDAEGEARFITFGMDAASRTLVVVYTYRAESVRIISARRATTRERKTYARGI